MHLHVDRAIIPPTTAHYKQRPKQRGGGGGFRDHVHVRLTIFSKAEAGLLRAFTTPMGVNPEKGVPHFAGL